MIGVASIQQSGALPYEYRDDTLWILLVQSNTSKRWILPKGNLEPGLTPSESAYFEAFEEAGVVGKIENSSIGSYSYRKTEEKGGELCRVRIFPLAVTQALQSYPEREVRIREWMEASQAVEAIAEPKLKTLVAEFVSRLQAYQSRRR